MPDTRAGLCGCYLLISGLGLGMGEFRTRIRELRYQKCLSARLIVLDTCWRAPMPGVPAFDWPVICNSTVTTESSTSDVTACS